MNKKNPTRSTMTAKGIFALNIFVIAIAAGTLIYSWNHEIQTAKSETLATTRLLEVTTSQTFDKLALSLEFFAADIEENLAAGHILQQSIASADAQVTRKSVEIQTIVTFDATGHQVCGNKSNVFCKDISIAGDPIFDVMRERERGKVHLFGSVNNWFDPQEKSLLLFYPLRNTNNIFVGAVVAVIPVDRIIDVIKDISAGETSAVGLRGLDMSRIARWPALAAKEENITISSKLASMIEQNPAEGVYFAKTPNDGIYRISAYKQLSGWPMYALIGTGIDDVLAQWYITVALVLGCTLAFSLASYGLVRTLRRENEQQNRAKILYETAPCGYHTLNREGIYLSVNETELSWLQTTYDDVFGRLSPRDFLAKEYHPIFDKKIARVLAGECVNNVAFEVVGKSGDRRYVAVNARPIFDALGKVSSINSVMYDMTSLHLAQQEIRHLADNQARMLETDLVGIAKIRGKQFIWANKGMSRVFGYQRDAFIGMPVSQLFPSQSAYEKACNECFPIIMEGKIHRLEVLMKHQSGDQIWVDIGGSPLVENTEEILFMATDITDKKKAEEIRLRDFEIRTQNEHLQETNRLKNEFLANMSHELRTQLAGILGYAEILKKAARTEQEIPEETYKKYVDGIIVGGSNLLGLIQTQLDYVKVESDKMAFYADGVFLDDIINEVVYIKSKKAKEKNIQIHVVCTEHYKIMSDALRIRQILSILLDNAIQFSMREKNIHVRSIKLPGDSFEIDIEDQGIGIGIADYERIFYPFYQVSSGLSKTYGGAGMGLALARKIARAMGGDITVKSMPSVGSTFVLKLPISQLT